MIWVSRLEGRLRWNSSWQSQIRCDYFATLSSNCGILYGTNRTLVEIKTSDDDILADFAIDGREGDIIDLRKLHLKIETYSARSFVQYGYVEDQYKSRIFLPVIVALPGGLDMERK